VVIDAVEPHLDAAIAYLKEKGLRVLAGPTLFPDGPVAGLRFNYFLDPWGNHLELYAGAWELPTLGTVAAPNAVLIRPDGYVAWVGTGTDDGLRDALTTWFGPPTR